MKPVQRNLPALRKRQPEMPVSETATQVLRRQEFLPGLPVLQERLPEFPGEGFRNGYKT